MNASEYASRAGSAVRYASRTTGVDFEKILTWVAIGGVAYIVYKTLSIGSSIKSGLNEAGSAIGLTLYDWIHGENAGIGETTFYSVYFPDGKFHAVPSLSVDSMGVFKNNINTPNYKGDGKVYRIARAAQPIIHPVTKKPFSRLYAVPL